MKAVGYTMITAREETAGHRSCSEQEAKIRTYAKAQGLDMGDIFSDESIGILASAPNLGEITSRSGLIALLDEAPTKGWLIVVVDGLDRIQREDLDFDPREELRLEGKRVVQIGEQLNLDLQEQKRKRARLQRPRKALSVAERLLRGREAGARAGKHQSGPAPYGYIRDYTHRSTKGVQLSIHPGEAEVVRTIFKEYLRRKSMKRLIEHLEREGLRTRRLKQWSRAGVSWILKNETYLGRVHFGKIRAKGQHPAIISPIIFNKVQKLIKKNNKRGGKGKKNAEIDQVGVGV